MQKCLLKLPKIFGRVKNSWPGSDKYRWRQKRQERQKLARSENLAYQKNSQQTPKTLTRFRAKIRKKTGCTDGMLTLRPVPEKLRSDSKNLVRPKKYKADSGQIGPCINTPKIKNPKISGQTSNNFGTNLSRLKEISPKIKVESKEIIWKDVMSCSPTKKNWPDSIESKTTGRFGLAPKKFIVHRKF